MTAYDDQVLAALYACDGMATCKEVCDALVPGRHAGYGDVYAALRRMEVSGVVRRQWYENSQLVFWETVRPPVPVDALEESFGA